MKKLIILLFILCPIALSGQTFSGKKPIRMPDKYKKPNFRTIADLSPTGTFSSQNWVVWIDRANAETSNGRVPGFMERYLVVEQNERKLHLVSDDGTYNKSLGEFVGEPVDFGWIEKDFCILSPSALYSERTGFRNKVMTITTPELMQKDMERIKAGAKKLAFYDTPTASSPNENETPLFEIFYVLKRVGKRYLLCKRPDISQGRSVDFVNGWVDTASVQLWDQRQSLEPSWEKNAVLERTRDSIKASVFADSLAASAFVKTRDDVNALWNADRGAERYSSVWKRFPIFKKTGNLVETAVVSDLVQESGKKTKSDLMDEIKQKLEEQTIKASNINMVFVIDGTNSMGPYINSVRNAVIDGALLVQNSDNKFKFGAVIYRDYDTPDQDKCYQVQRLTDYKQFIKFLAGVDTQNPACADQTTSEGLYLGLKKIENVLRGNEKMTNVVIVIGDSGDRDGTGRITEKDVIPVIIKYGCSVLSIQVHHGRDQSYEDFNWQLTTIGSNCALRMVDTLKKNYGKLNLSILKTQPKWQQSNNGNRTLFNLENSPISGAHQYVRRDEVISEEMVKNEVKRIIAVTDTNNNELIGDMRKLLYASVVPDSTKEAWFTMEGIQLLSKAGLTYEEIAIIREKNYQFMLRGFTPLKIDKLQFALYNYVLFLDQQELNDIITSLEKLVNDPTQSNADRRKKLKEAWQELLRVNYGVGRDEMETKTMGELMFLITGLPSVNPLLKYRVDDLTDINRISDDQLQVLVNKIKQSRDDLIRLSGDRKFYFSSNGRAFYWIPQGYLP